MTSAPPVNEFTRPSRSDKNGWRFELVHPGDGRILRFVIEDMQGDEYCYTRRGRFSTDRTWNGVVVSKWASWDVVCDSVMHRVLGAKKEGFVRDVRFLKLWHPDGRKASIEILENAFSVDFRAESYSIATRKTPVKGNESKEGWPSSPTTIKLCRERFAEMKAQALADGYQEGDAPPPPPKQNPLPEMKKGDSLVEWRVYHFKGGSSDKVYSVEMWKREPTPPAGQPSYFVTARHGRRNASLTDLRKCEPTSFGMADHHFQKAVNERASKGYKQVDPASVNVKAPTPPPPVPALAQPAPNLTPKGVRFYCQKCNHVILPTKEAKDNIGMGRTFAFSCHGLLATRDLTEHGIDTFAERAKTGTFHDQQIDIFVSHGGVNAGSKAAGTDPSYKAPANLPHLNLPTVQPPTPVAASKASKPTVNDPPPVKVGTMVPDALGVQSFGKRKVRFRVDDNEEEA